MANTEEFRNKLNEFMKKYPKSIMIVRNENDVDKLDFSKLIKGSSQDFANTDDRLISYISQCLIEGKEVALQAVGKDKILVSAAKDLFKKSYY